MKKLLKAFLVVALLFPANSLFAQSLVKDILDPVVDGIVTARTGTPVTLDIEVTDITGSLLSNLLSVNVSLRNATSNNFQIKNVQRNSPNELISFQVEYFSDEEGMETTEVVLETGVNLIPIGPPIEVKLTNISINTANEYSFDVDVLWKFK